MFKFNNNHIFTGFLKQLLSSFNLPTCRIYTSDYAKYRATHGVEDPRVVESVYSATKDSLPIRINYLKGNEIFNYYNTAEEQGWRKVRSFFYEKDHKTPGLTRKLKSPGTLYDSATHEYLGDFLRFIRDYFNVNLMPLYNCYSNNYCNNIYLERNYIPQYQAEMITDKKQRDVLKVPVKFDSNDNKYKIYVLPVKLFENYTIAIDCNQTIELFCGFYNNVLDTSEKAMNLFDMTYQVVNNATFQRPFLYTKLNVDNWSAERDREVKSTSSTILRREVLNKEQDLKLFLKVPINCRSSIVILEGDYRCYNDFKYTPGGAPNSAIRQEVWKYQANHTVINFGNSLGDNNLDREAAENLNTMNYALISRLQLLAFNTGESYPFADRLVEYLTGSAISPVDGIYDNIQRAQKVMNENGHYFKIDGRWEPKMQKIAYNYMVNEGPFDFIGNKIIDQRKGKHPRQGYATKSCLYDILGFIDKDVEKYYANWKVSQNRLRVDKTIHNVDIYDGLYELD